MTVEAASFISQLDPTLPAAGDPRSQGDDHLRLTKSVLQTQFPNLGAAAVTPTAAQINVLLKTPAAFLLATASASNSATIDFTALIDSTYEEYELHIIEAIPATNAANPWLRKSTDAGATFASTAGDYGWTNLKGKTTTATVANSSTTDTKFLLTDASVANTAAYGGYSGVVRIFNPAASASLKRFRWEGSSAEDSSQATLTVSLGVGTTFVATAINALRFMFSTGNIASGKFKLYGITKA